MTKLKILFITITFGLAHFSAQAADESDPNQSFVAYNPSAEAFEAVLAKKLFIPVDHSQAFKGSSTEPVMTIELVGDTTIELSDEELIARTKI